MQNLLPTTEKNIKSLEGLGYQVSFHTEEKEYQMTGKFTAFIASIIKDGVNIQQVSSRHSYDDAFNSAYTIFQFVQSRKL